MSHEAQNQIPGFVSQRVFQKANQKYNESSRQDGKFSDPVSREMIASGEAKGTKGEYIVAEMLAEMGYEVMVILGKKSYDVKAKIKGKWRRIEVKTAGQKGRSHQFGFCFIKTNRYDLLATVFVGYDYTSVQISGEEGKKFIDRIGNLSKKTKRPGRTISFNQWRTHCKLQGLEAFFDMTKKNIERLV
tara:strand:+ start:378 stop:941 length:564 start_codon:yes stop_codon:yes gene_type:complete